MKINVFPKSFAHFFAIAFAVIAMPAHGALIMQYTFEGSGTSLTNEGTLGSSANLGTFNSTDQPADLRTASGTGVGGVGQAGNFLATPNTAGPYGITSGAVALNITTGFTISGWLDMATWTSASSVFRNQSGNAGMSLLVNSNDRLQLQLGSGSGSTNLNPTNGAYAGAVDEGWMFFAITWDGSTVTFYRGDDELASSLSVVGTSAYTAGVANNASTAFALGNTAAATNDRPLNGLMDDFRIYNNFLNASEVNAVRLSAVPEPSQVSLLLAALAGCILFAKKKGAKAV